MDFRDTPEEAAFRKEVRDWLEQNLGEEFQTSRFSVGPEADERVDVLKAWQRKLHEGGWAGVSWPKEYGGRGASLIEQAIFYQEMARAKAPSPINVIGIGMAGPTIIAHGTEAQKQRYLSKILSGEEIWCQGFSEPGAGSDLAALRSTAVEDGDHYVINGQKVWTTLAHLAKDGGHCIFVARTDPEAPKHQGLSYFLVDMTSPGIEVRPLVQITGTPEFNEMFLTDVRVPKENMLGKPGDGWRIAMTTLMHERGTLGFALSVQARIALDGLVQLARETKRHGKPAIEDSGIRQRIAQLHVEVEAMRLNNYRGLSTTIKTGIPGPEGSLGKLLWSEAVKRMTDLAVELLGPEGLLLSSKTNESVARWQFAHLRARGHTIEAGTSEILRNIIAERVLGLPRHK
ncbi:MAG TPA: acyl-CoA dehydrogenase [Actinomycetota bacterium]|nr:acyl-CoA dehydrogenase [Actinomycetota bacterium]